MSQVKRILQALVALGTSTYDDLESKTEIPRNKLRWACSGLKSEGYIKQTEEPLTNEVAWQITPYGRQHLIKIAGEGIEAAAPRKTPQPITADMAKTKAKTAKKSNEKLQTTPADGGGNIIRSQASGSVVDAATSSPEGQAVVEQQALVSPAAPAGSDVKSEIEIIASEMFQLDDDNLPVEFTDPQLFAMVSIDGTLHIAFADQEINLPAFAVRQLGEFLSDTEPVWA